MKTELTIISDDLNHGIIDEKKARTLLLDLLDVSGSFISKFQEIIYSDLSDSEIVNALHKLDNDR